ncbi:aminotransferase [Arthrobacter sp. MYb227]|uniref:aminotransferase class V-fold PLP-dependent enzyme n=1 Tax=Arthrobacter sp. MYb227 TaxID=1848601 RepID=UPI000CFC2983|nr:aminotransferase class V-fold PLP-dependent enzyme [Arthrobacter sp. MYb227]PQZ95121.1 aminotransferase [Arthrobacter sp. MYb227]
MNVSTNDLRVPFENYTQEFSESAGYLDFARIGPLSNAVVTQKTTHASLLQQGGPAVLGLLDNLVEKARVSSATLLQARTHEVAFVSSTSHGMFAAALALSPLQGTVLVPRNDFPANTYPWIRAAERGGLSVRWIDGPMTADTIREALDPQVKAVAVSAVDAGTGFVVPLAQLKEVIGEDRVLAVDAVQAFGAVPFDTDAADVLATGGQKWLRAGWGAAALMVRDRVSDKLQPGLGGWSGVDNPLGSAPHPHPTLRGALAHTVTNPDSIAVASFGIGTDLVLGTGLHTINSALRAGLEALLESIVAAGGEVENHSPQSGIARFRMPGIDSTALFSLLAQAGIHATQRGPWIRISAHATTGAESAALLSETLSRVSLASIR